MVAPRHRASLPVVEAERSNPVLLPKKPGGDALAGYGHVGSNKAYVHALEGTGGYSPPMQRAARRIKAGDGLPSTEHTIRACSVLELPTRKHLRIVAGEGQAPHYLVHLGLPRGRANIHIAGYRVECREVPAAYAVDGA